MHTAAAAWSYTLANTRGRSPVVAATARSLTIDDWPGHGYNPLDAGRNAWDVALPTTPLDVLDLTTFANRAHVDLAGASVGRLRVSANASDVVVDAAGASMQNLSAVLNVGSLALTLPSASDLTGSLRIGGGRLRLCAPTDLGLRVTTRGLPRELHIGGAGEDGSIWQSPDYASAAHRADLTVTVNFGTVEINPIGGCS
jgi:hypothetical protein